MRRVRHACSLAPLDAGWRRNYATDAYVESLKEDSKSAVSEQLKRLSLLFCLAAAAPS